MLAALGYVIGGRMVRGGGGITYVSVRQGQEEQVVCRQKAMLCISQLMGSA